MRTPSTVYPGLTYHDAEAAIEWLCRVFGFQKRLVVPGPEGAVMHSELSLGDAVVMIGTVRPEAGRLSPRDLSGVTACVSIYVEDPDAHYANAVAGGAEILQELKDEEYGSRGYLACDLEGHQWCFATYRPGAFWSTPETDEE